MASAVKVETRGRVTLPTQLRLALDVQPGDEVEFVESSPSHFEVKATWRKPAFLRNDDHRYRTSREAPTRAAIRSSSFRCC